MGNDHDDDLLPSTTEGYNPGEKKTVEEYAKLHEGDDSLNRWKASLGIGESATIGDKDDKRTVCILQLCLEVDDRPNVVIDLDSPDAVESLAKKPFTIKEGTTYNMLVKFRVQHELISGLRYLQRIKRGGLPIDKSEEMMGSFLPNTLKNPVYEKKFTEKEAPSGMLYRGHYDVFSRFMDDDRRSHLEFHWSLDVKKSWD